MKKKFAKTPAPNADLETASLADLKNKAAAARQQVTLYKDRLGAMEMNYGAALEILCDWINTAYLNGNGQAVQRSALVARSKHLLYLSRKQLKESNHESTIESH